MLPRWPVSNYAAGERDESPIDNNEGKMSFEVCELEMNQDEIFITSHLLRVGCSVWG